LYPLLDPHNGLGARSAPKRYCLTRRGLCRDIKGRALDWLASTPTAGQDQRRLRSVLARRRARSRQFFASAAGQWERIREAYCAAVRILREIPLEQSRLLTTD